MLYPVVVKIQCLLCTWPHLGCMGPHLDRVDVLPLGGEPLLDHPDSDHDLDIALPWDCGGVFEAVFSEDGWSSSWALISKKW